LALGQAQIWKFRRTKSGPHALLQEGAELKETGADIFEKFEATVVRSGEKALLAATVGQREPLFKYIDRVPNPIDHIIKRSGLTATTVSSMLIRFGTARAGQCGVGGYLRALEPLQ